MENESHGYRLISALEWPSLPLFGLIFLCFFSGCSPHMEVSPHDQVIAALDDPKRPGPFSTTQLESQVGNPDGVLKWGEFGALMKLEGGTWHFNYLENNLEKDWEMLANEGATGFRQSLEAQTPADAPSPKELSNCEVWIYDWRNPRREELYAVGWGQVKTIVKYESTCYLVSTGSVLCCFKEERPFKE